MRGADVEDAEDVEDDEGDEGDEGDVDVYHVVRSQFPVQNWTALPLWPPGAWNEDCCTVRESPTRKSE